MIHKKQTQRLKRETATILTNTVWLVAFGHFLLELFHQYLPVVYPLFREEFGLTYGQVGIVALVATTTTSVGQPLFGYFIDRWDARRITALSVIWLGLVMALVGFSNHYQSLLLAVALAGFGSAAFHPAGASVISKAVSRDRAGRAISFFAVGGNVGSAISPLLLAIGLKLVGLKGTVVLLPIVVVAGSWLLMGLGQEGSDAREAHRQRQSRAGQGFVLGLLLITLVSMTRSWFQLSLTTYLPTLLEGRGHSVVFGGQMLFIFSLFIGVGSLLGGILADRVGRWQVLLVCFTLLGPAFWLFLHTSGMVHIMLMAGTGFLLGCTYPTAVVISQEIWPQGLALASGLVMGLGWWPGGLGASFTGWLADQITLDAALQSLVIAPILGALLMMFLALALRNRDSSLGPDLAGSPTPTAVGE